MREEQVLSAHQLHWRYAADSDGSLRELAVVIGGRVDGLKRA